MMSRDMPGAVPSARQRANNFFDIGVVGRRTGLTIRENVKKDADGIDNIDDFWRDEGEDEDEDEDEEGEETQPSREEYYDQHDDYAYGHNIDHHPHHQQQQQPAQYAPQSSAAQYQPQQQPQPQPRRRTQWPAAQRPRLQETIPEELLNSTPSSRKLRREGSAGQMNTHSSGNMSLSTSAGIRDPMEATEMMARARHQAQLGGSSVAGSSRYGGAAGGGFTPNRTMELYSPGTIAAAAENDYTYQSPAFSAVKKRLVFTQDLSDSDSEKGDRKQQQQQQQQREQVSGSMARGPTTRPRSGSNASLIFDEQVLSPPYSFPAQPSQTAALAASISRQQRGGNGVGSGPSTSSQARRQGGGIGSSDGGARGGGSGSGSRGNIATLESALAQQRQMNQQASSSSSSSLKAFDLFGQFDQEDVDEYYNEYDRHHGQLYPQQPQDDDYDDGNAGDWHAEDYEAGEEVQEEVEEEEEKETLVPRRNASRATASSRAGATTAATTALSKGKGRAKQLSGDVATDGEDDEGEDHQHAMTRRSTGRGRTSAKDDTRAGSTTTAAVARVPSVSVELSDSAPADDTDAVPQLPAKGISKGAPRKKKPAETPAEEGEEDEEHGEESKNASGAKTLAVKGKATTTTTRQEKSSQGSQKSRPTTTTTKKPSSQHSAGRTAATVLEVEKLQVAPAPVPSSITTSDGGKEVRRSGRQRVHTLEYWKNERVVYETDKETQVPVAMAVMRAASVEPTFHPSRKRKRPAGGVAGGKKTATARKSAVQSKKASKKAAKNGKTGDEEQDDEEDDDEEDEDDEEDAGESGFQKVGENLAETVQYGTDDIVMREIAITKSMYKFTEVQSGGYSFFPSFRDGGFMSSGIMKFPVGGVKPNKNSNASSMMFYVVRGRVKVTIYKTTFVLASGGSFHVPRGNQYKIENVARNKESVLCFFQAKPNDELSGEGQQSSSTTTIAQQPSDGTGGKGKKTWTSTPASSTLLSGGKRPVSKPGAMPPPSSSAALSSSRSKASSSRSKA